ncbi:hypothetical protein OROGR_001680 [Orobanche gracilis]
MSLQVVIIISQVEVNCMNVVRLKSIDTHGLSDQSGEYPLQFHVHLTSNVEQVRVGKAIYRAESLFNHSCQPNIHAYFLSRTLYLRTTKVVASGHELELSYGPQVGLWDCKDRRDFLKDEYAFHCQCTGCSEVNLSDIVLNAFRCANPNCSGAVLESRVLDCEKQKIRRSPVADKGYCLKCDSYSDMESSRAAVDKALICAHKKVAGCDTIKRSCKYFYFRCFEISSFTESKFARMQQAHCRGRPKTTLPRLFVQWEGELQLFLDHCKASIHPVILKKLYDPDDIVIAYELLKLSSIQLSLDDATVIYGQH